MGTLPHCVEGEEGTQVWTTAIPGGLFCRAVPSASIYYRATFLCGHPVSFPLPTSHAQDPRLHAGSSSFVCKPQAGLAVTGNTGGKGAGSGTLLGLPWVAHGRLLSAPACLPLLKTLTD